MEHAQRVFVKRIYKIIFLLCLNPYFNGTCSKRKVTSFFKSNYCVLILILMEHAQRVKRKKMEKQQISSSLNPYFNGTCSKRRKSHCRSFNKMVLILILMEHAQRGNTNNRWLVQGRVS